MLKIKDSVDLRELTKFYFGEGFTVGDNIYEKYYYWKHLYVDVTTRRIYLDKREKHEVEYDVSLCKLYDLIQAGLVEKLEE
mgnify:CR=1 FL=1